MQHTSVPANATGLSNYSKTTCPLAGMAEQAKKAIEAYTDADNSVLPNKNTIMKSASAILRNMEDAAGCMLASSPEGALFQVCTLIGHTDNALDFMHEDALPGGQAWLTHLQTGLKGVLQYLENQHGIDREDMGLEWYCSRKLQDIAFPAGAAATGVAITVTSLEARP